MEKGYRSDSITINNMEDYCYEVANKIRLQPTPEYISVDQSYNMVSPLWHYIASGRASIDFCRKLVETKPYLIARRILQGGSDDEIMERIKKYINF